MRTKGAGKSGELGRLLALSWGPQNEKGDQVCFAPLRTNEVSVIIRKFELFTSPSSIICMVSLALRPAMRASITATSATIH